MPAADHRDLEEFARTGSAAAFERLARRYANLVYGVCLRRLGGPPDAEDAAQAVFLALARKAKSVRPGKLASWLHGAAIRASKMAARGAATRARHEEGAAHMRNAKSEPAGESWDEVRPHLDAEVDRLPARLREPLVRHYFAGRSYAQIGEEFGLAKTTVAGRVQAGLERLRGRLARRGVSLGAAAFGALLTGKAQPGAPESLLTSLPRLATGSAATGAAAGGAAGVNAIAEGVLRMMFMEKLKTIGVALAAAAVVSVAVPLAVSAVGAGERAEPKPAKPAPKTAAKPPTIKPEWKGKLLVQVLAGANNPAWSPDGKRAACCVVLKREKGRGYWKTTEGGVGVVELASGKISKVSLNKGGPVIDLIWMPGGKRLIAAGREQLWSVEVAAGGLKARPFAKLPGKLFTRFGQHGMSLSPDAKFLLCGLRKERGPRGARLKGPDYVVFDAAGKKLASFEGGSAVWNAKGRKLFFGRYEKLCSIELPGGKETVLFSSGDYFKAGAPKTHATWLWSPKPIAELKSGKLVVEIVEAAGPKWEPKCGVVIIKGEAAVWNPAKNSFLRLGPTRHGIHGEIDYIPMGREDLFLRRETTRGFRQGKTIMQLVKADTGKVLLELKPPRTAKHEAQDINLGVSLLTASPDGDTAIFSGSGTITKMVGKNRSVSRGKWFGLFILEVPTGIFKRVELPLARRPYDAAIAPGGDLLVLSGRLKDKKTKDGKYIEGLWLCDPAGKGVLTARE